MRIEKKVWKQYFDRIANGDKNFELRLADWTCEEGDILVLKEWDSMAREYTGRVLERKVTYVIKTKDIDNAKMWPKEDVDKYGYQIISFK